MPFLLRFSVSLANIDTLIPLFASKFPDYSMFYGANHLIHYQAFCVEKPDYRWVEALYELALVIDQDPTKNIDKKPFLYHIAPLPEKDWLQENIKGMKPFKVSDFLIVPGGGQMKISPYAQGQKIIKISGSLAFGTGSHATTQLCLKYLIQLAKKNAPTSSRISNKKHHQQRLPCKNQTIRRILDLGTGTGILAIAAALLFKNANIIGTDISHDAIRIAQNNVAVNRLLPRKFHFFHTKRANIIIGKKYDLIIANILVTPLIGLEKQISQIMPQGGWLILSGLLDFQAASLNAVYRNHFTLQRKYYQGEWVAMLYQRK